MLEFLRKLFAPERSSETAKERLKLVLLSDHLSLAPETVEALKRDLLEVISRYVEIDAGHADVTFEQRPHEVAMLASIPITGVRERTVEAPVAPSAAALQSQPVLEDPSEAAPALDPHGATVGVAAGEPADVEPLGHARPPDPAVAANESTAALPARSANAGPPRRRRRKKSAALRALAQAHHAPPVPGQSVPGAP